MKYQFLYAKNFEQFLNSKKQKLAVNFFLQSQGRAAQRTRNEARTLASRRWRSGGRRKSCLFQKVCLSPFLFRFKQMKIFPKVFLVKS